MQGLSAAPFFFWRFGQALGAQGRAEVQLRYLCQVGCAVFGDKILGGCIDGGGGAFRKLHFELLFQSSQSSHELVARQNGGCGNCQVRFRFMALHQLDLTAQTHQGVGHRLFVGSELIADSPDWGRIHAMLLAHQILDHARMSPRQERVYAAHFFIKPVVSLVANWDHAADTTSRLTDDLRHLPNSFITGEVFGIADTDILPRFHHRCVHVNSGDAHRAEKIAFATFVHAEPGQQQIRIKHRLVSQAGFLQDFRFEHEFNEFLSSLPLQDQLATLVEDGIEFFLFGGESGVRNFTKLKTVVLQVSSEGGRLLIRQFAGVGTQWFHKSRVILSRLLILRNVRKSNKPERRSALTLNPSPIGWDKGASGLVPSLLSWFRNNARDLPWRRTSDPYAIWVSEIMLQQTQVKTVIPYWERWMRQLPDVAALARAKPQRVLKLWEGLGYYTRARNLQRAAGLIVTQHAGEFPRQFAQMLALPGIGRYTAGAIGSIAFNQALPILDGNVIRVLTRLFGIHGNPRAKTTNAQLWKLADALVSAAAQSGSAGDRNCSHLNQALMELGALICSPTQPKCELCPVHAGCVARATGQLERLPNLGPRVPSTARRFVAIVVENRRCFLLRRRPAGVVNAHLWEFPNTELSGKSVPLEQTARAILGIIPSVLRPLCTIRHTITRYRMTLDVYRATISRRPAFALKNGRWLSWSALKPLPFTSAHGKILRMLAKSRAEED